MKVLITGGAGFLGTQLGRTLLQHNQLQGRPIKELVLADLAPPESALAEDPRVRVVQGPLMDDCAALAAQFFDVVFHLAGAVSAECESNFELGMQSNLDTTRALLDAHRLVGHCPRFVFASSVAVFGNDCGLRLPEVILDDTLPTPQSSYGIQKFISEQLIADYTRRGFVDGRSGRLMTVVVRPGRPNGAASGFLSAIVREPLNEMETVCPVPPEMPVALASPSNTIHALIRLAEADREELGGRTAVNFPALTVKVSQILDALEQLAGESARERVLFKAEPAITRIVGSWPSVFKSSRAARLGLVADTDMISIIREFLNEHGAVCVGV